VLRWATAETARSRRVLLWAEAVAQTKAVGRMRQAPFSSTSRERRRRHGRLLRDTNDPAEIGDLVANAQELDEAVALCDSRVSRTLKEESM